MFEKKKSSVQDDSIPPRLEWFEYPGFLFSFLWFHRGALLAVLVLLGLYYFLTVAKDKVAENKRLDEQASTFVVVPTIADPESLTGSSFKENDTRRVPPLPTDPMPLVDRPDRGFLNLADDPSSIRFRKFVSTADVDSLLRRSKILLQQIPRLNPTEAVMNITRRQQISERMRQMELTPSQQDELTVAELESLSQLDAINVQHRMELPNSRDQLFRLATSLLDHPTASVSSKAHLAIVAAYGIDVLIDPTQEELDVLVNAYHTHIENIMRGAGEPIIIAGLLQGIVVKHQLDEVIELRRDVANRALNHESPEVNQLGVALKERIIFGDLGLPSLISRMDGISDSTFDDIDNLYHRLENYPETRKPIYQIAVAVIGKHLLNEDFDHASRLVDWLQRIHPRIPDLETKHWVGESLSQYSEKIRLAQINR